MPITINHVLPWGRSLAEYREMFALTDEDMERSIFGIADGPASFNAQATSAGSRVISADPLYEFSAPTISCRIEDTFATLIQFAQENHENFRWDGRVRSPEHLGQIRREAMTCFLADYEQGRSEGRYVAAELPALPFPDGCFDIALCSHFLFLYSKQFSTAWHIDSICELARVANQVRIFPLLDLQNNVSVHLEPAREELAAKGLRTQIKHVGYEFQKGANQMLQVDK